MIYKFLTLDNKELFFGNISDEIWHKITQANNGILNIFASIPNVTKIDILEYFEYAALIEAESDFEIDEGFLGDFDRDSYETLDDKLISNDPKPTYTSEYIATIGQLFLSNLIDFCCSDEKDTLFHSFENPFMAWKYFRDNFLYNYWEFLYDYDNKGDKKPTWKDYQSWHSWDIVVLRTQKGTRYLNEILAPKFYNKYKDLEVEIDDKGNVLRWIGEINRETKNISK